MMRFAPFGVMALWLGLNAQPAAAWGIPKEYTDPWNNPHPDCPTDTHILGQGIASTSDGAREKARADVIRNVNSKIESEVTRASQVLQSNSHTSSNISLKQVITEKSQFDYGHKIVDLGKTRKHKKQYYALACLDKSETADTIWKDIQPQLAVFEAKYSILQQAVLDKNRPLFAKNYLDAIKAFNTVMPKLFLMTSLGEGLRSRKYLSTYASIFMDAEHLRASALFSIQLDATLLSEEVLPIWSQSLRQEVESLGLSLGAENLACNTSSITHTLNIDPQEKCKQIMGNHVCSYSPIIAIQDCQSNEQIRISITSKKLSGGDSRSKERALKQAGKGFDGSDYRKPLREALQNNIPLKEP